MSKIKIKKNKNNNHIVTFVDVFPVDDHRVIAVLPGLLVEQSENVQELMLYGALVDEARWRFQVHRVRRTEILMITDHGITALRSFPDDVKILGVSDLRGRVAIFVHESHAGPRLDLVHGQPDLGQFIRRCNVIYYGNFIDEFAAELPMIRDQRKRFVYNLVPDICLEHNVDSF